MGLNKNFKVRVPKCPFDERHQKLGECEDWEACDSTLHIGHLFGPNGVQWDFCRKGSKLSSDDKEEKQAKKDYYEASNCVLEIVYVLGSNRVQREFYRKSSKMYLSWREQNN